MWERGFHVWKWLLQRNEGLDSKDWQLGNSIRFLHIILCKHTPLPGRLPKLLTLFPVPVVISETAEQGWGKEGHAELFSNCKIFQIYKKI